MPAKRSDVVWSEATEQVLTQHLMGGRASWDREPNFPLDQIVRDPVSQSRLHRVDQTRVNAMVTKRKQQVQFPPIIVWNGTDNGSARLVDGNHRLACDLKMGLTHAPVYIVQLTDNDEAVYLSAVFNAQAGKPLERDELRRAILAASRMSEPPSDARLARDYGVTASQVGKIRNQDEAEHRLQALSVSGSDRLTQGVLLPLNRIRLATPLREAARLVVDADMQATDVRALVTDVVALGSEREQIERIEQERAERSRDIEAVRAGRRATGSPLSELRRSVSTLEKAIENYPDPQSWVTNDPALTQVWRGRVASVAAFLESVADAHRTLDVA